MASIHILFEAFCKQYPYTLGIRDHLWIGTPYMFCAAKLEAIVPTASCIFNIYV